MTQHGYPYQDPAQQGGQQHGGQPPYGQPGSAQQHGQPARYGQPAPARYGQPQAPQEHQYGQQAYPEQQYAQQAYPEHQYGQVPASGYGVPAGAGGYGHVAHPPAGGFPGQQQAGYASQRPSAPNGQELADVWMRLLARMIDGLIVGGLVSVIVVPLVVVIFVLTVNSGDSGGTFVGVLLLTELAAFVLTLVGQYVYDVEYAKRSGQTVGKRVLKLRIVPLDPRQPLDRGTLAKRWLVSSPGGLVPGLGLFNALWCLWDQPYRQCLHDKFAKTVVVKVPA